MKITPFPFIRQVVGWIPSFIARLPRRRPSHTEALRRWTVELETANTALAREITERKRVEQELRQAEAKYRSIFENAVEGIFQTTPEGQYLSVNPALACIYGYETPDELMKSLTDISEQLYVDTSR